MEILDLQISNIINEEYKELKKELGNVEEYIKKILKKGYEIEQITENVIVNVMIVSDDEIKKINKENRGIDKITDVLSFPMFENNELNLNVKTKQDFPIILGDIVLNIEQIKRQAKEYETGIKREFSYMLVHSFYHLLGYDHMQIEDKEKMRAKEEKLLGELL